MVCVFYFTSYQKLWGVTSTYGVLCRKVTYGPLKSGRRDKKPTDLGQQTGSHKEIHLLYALLIKQDVLRIAGAVQFPAA